MILTFFLQYASEFCERKEGKRDPAPLHAEGLAAKEKVLKSMNNSLTFKALS